VIKKNTKSKPIKKRLKFREVRVNPFKVWIQIAIGDDVHLTANELAKVCGTESSFPPSKYGKACFATIPIDDNLWKFITIQPCVFIEEIAHECFHAIVHLSGPDGRCDPITMESNECYAYIFENLFKDVLIAYKQLGGKIKQ